jgi:hypothetical protein
MKKSEVFGTALMKDDLIRKVGLDLINAFPRRPDQISVGPGLNQQDDDVCSCGHWAGQHRNGGKNTCEGFRCGCYTFQQVKSPDDSTQGPRCQVCKKPVLGKRVTRKADRANAFEVMWIHADRECITEGATPIERDEVLKDVFWLKKTDESEPVRFVTTDSTNERRPVNLGPSDWVKEIEQERAQRERPTRAPFELGGDEHV